MCITPQEALDLNYLRAMIPETPTDAVAFLEMIEQAYESSAGSTLQIIRTACATQDVSSLKKAAHSLKGACQSLGATPMANILLELELAGPQVDWTRAVTLVQTLEVESPRVPAGLQAFRRAIASA